MDAHITFSLPGLDVGVEYDMFYCDDDECLVVVETVILAVIKMIETE